MSPNQIIELMRYYTRILGVDPARSDTKSHNRDSNTALRHIVWMCGEVIEFAETQRMAKAHRWIGFIQGVLWSYGVLSIDQMRMHNLPIPFMPTTTIQRFRSNMPNIANNPKPNIADNPKPLWYDNTIQFARLLCEIRMACEMEGFDQVMESMDLDDEQMDELWRRAEAVWEKAKADHCPPPKAKTEEGNGVGSCRMPECPHCKVALVKDGSDVLGTVHCPKCSTVFQSIRVRCDDCGWKGLECEIIVKLDLISTSRLDVGGEVPSGQCPKCGALAYLERPDNKVIPHLAHLDQLEVVAYGRTGKVPDSVTVECTKCGGVVHELFIKEFEG